MRIVYTGPFDAVEVPELGTVIQRGTSTEVPDDIGKTLCEQLCWEQVKSGGKPSKNEEKI